MGKKLACGEKVVIQVLSTVLANSALKVGDMEVGDIDQCMHRFCSAGVHSEELSGMPATVSFGSGFISKLSP